jgi:hypothetical protein
MNSEKCSRAMKIARHIYIQRSGARILAVENAKTRLSILVVRSGTENVPNVGLMNRRLPTPFFTE